MESGPGMRGFVVLMVGGGLILAGCGSSRHDPGMTDPGTPLPTDTVSGTVSFEGASVAGATVTEWLTNTNQVTATTVTDAAGHYSFSGIQTSGDVPGEYNFWVKKAGFGFYPSAGAGWKVERYDHTGNMAGTMLPGEYLTVIDWTALADGSLSNANFEAYDGSNPLVMVAATGQEQSYAPGDDGALRKGVAWPTPRFTDNQDGTVSDALTGLIWLKDAGCLAPGLWADALQEANALANGSCGLQDGSKAGDWRLPNVNELESVVDVTSANPAVAAASGFTNVSVETYWSSTSYWGGQTGSPQALAIRMADGRFMNDGNANWKKTSTNRVWAVRGAGGGAVTLEATGMYVPYATGDDGSLQMGVPPTFPRFVDHDDGTVTDTVTGLVWLKMADCLQGDWTTALAAVQALATGQCGLSDGSQAGSWRMPNRNEMESLSDRMESDEANYFDQTYYTAEGVLFQPNVFSEFINGHYYWTSTTDAANPAEAWTVFSCDFGVYDTQKTDVGYTLAVR